MTEAQIYSWILLSVLSKNGNTRREISEMADAINHAVPTHQEMENSLRWLKENGLIAEKSGRFAQTQKGSDLVSFHGRATIRETWLRVEDAVREMISSSED